MPPSVVVAWHSDTVTGHTKKSVCIGALNAFVRVSVCRILPGILCGRQFPEKMSHGIRMRCDWYNNLVLLNSHVSSPNCVWRCRTPVHTTCMALKMRPLDHLRQLQAGMGMILYLYELKVSLNEILVYQPQSHCTVATECT